jgi:hypothetical protein
MEPFRLRPLLAAAPAAGVKLGKTRKKACVWGPGTQSVQVGSLSPLALNLGKMKLPGVCSPTQTSSWKEESVPTE